MICLFVGAGPGDPELITFKGKRVLDKADVLIYAGSLVNTVWWHPVPLQKKWTAGACTWTRWFP
ncbi:MAG: SAM-dependent methyltransferase [Methanomicrobiales archaeon]